MMNKQHKKTMFNTLMASSAKQNYLIMQIKNAAKSLQPYSSRI